MKKKSLIALLALVVACMLVFAACGDKADTDKGDSNADNTSASTELTTDENGEVFTPNEGTPLPLPSTPDVTEPTAPAGKTDAEKVADYVALEGTTIISMFESGFTSSGMNCTSTIEAVDTGIVLKICINDLVDIPEEQKAMLQSTFDQSAAALSGNFAPIQAEIPELTYVKFDFCEKDGDLIATFTIDGSEADEPTVDEPTVDEPVVSTGSASYIMREEEGIVGFTFLYNADGNVTEVIYSVTAENVDADTLAGIDEVYDALEQVRGMGCNIETDYLSTDSSFDLRATIKILGEIDVAFVGGLIEKDFTGATLSFADAESAVLALGFEAYELDA